MTIAPKINSDTEVTYPVGEGASLYVRGRALPASDRRILSAFISQIDTALRHRELASEAEIMRPAAEADRLRTALLAAVGHDLRRPLAAATTAITSLRSTEVTLSDHDRNELLEAAEVSLDGLADLVTKLLDASRLEAGVLGLTVSEVHLEDVVSGALDELELAPGEVNLTLGWDLPPVTADETLLQRAVVNVLANAVRFSPPGAPPTISTSQFGEKIQLRIIDSGPGIPDTRKAEAFAAFQRMGDTDNTTGVGLGLALSRGFITAMGGSLEAEDTPGGGLTMVIELDAVAGGRE